MILVILKWCSYCQSFAGETPEYDDLSITHGLCAACDANDYLPFEGRALAHAQFLHDIFGRLFVAGRSNNVKIAEAVIDEVIAAGCRPVDIPIGMIAPMLCQIGEDWKTGALTVEGEHRFTAFCDQVHRDDPDQDEHPWRSTARHLSPRATCSP
ncbi:hypothetical protein CK489_36695 [Bradyrhizobium sp. UFLA03-84]|nr:hypothetical protein CK489_36695 [Bradyrhizobium sp. UFLA03-84]